jgi:flavin-dependent dehydrogenase
MSNADRYDVAIIGGGLAGLSLAIQSASAGYATVLFEKEKYPFHKVCGEYISLESWDFLEDLGVPLSQMNLPVIRELLVSAPSGKTLEQQLPLGGFGISRYKLDAMLATIAKQRGVRVLEDTKVSDIFFENEIFQLATSQQNFAAKIVAGCFGKRSNLDVKWKRPFVLQKPNKLNHYIGVKYHIRIPWPEELIALHNFRNGYAGISKIENDACCFCYLTTADNLEASGHSVPEMEKNILSQNPHIKDLLERAEILYSSLVTISQVSFAKKSQVHDHVLLLGDAAGMITPLCGNGMSMAMHAAKIAFRQIDLFMQKKIPRWQMEQDYAGQWQKQFSSRLRTGRIIQRFFGSPVLSNLLVASLDKLPRLAKKLIQSTHGQPF